MPPTPPLTLPALGYLVWSEVFDVGGDGPVVTIGAERSEYG